MQKLLLVSYFLPPYLCPQSIQVGRFIKELKKYYEIHLVTAEHPGNEDGSLYPDLFDDIPKHRITKVKDFQPAWLSVLRHRVFPSLSKTPDVYRRWAQKAYQAVKLKYSQDAFDTMITFSFPLSTNTLGARLNAYFSCPWLAHQSDPWADNPFMNYGEKLHVLNSRMERESFQCADKLIFTCQEAAQFYKEKYLHLDSKIDFIDHSFDPSLYPLKTMKPETQKKVIRYVGSFYGPRTISPLLNALDQLSTKELSMLEIEIIGANLKTAQLLKKANVPDGLVKLTRRVNYRKSLDLMQTSDAIFVIDAPLAQDNIFFPSKLADYLGAKKPIIGISSKGPTCRILKRVGQPCHDHADTEGIVASIRRVLQGELMAPAELPEDYSCEYAGAKLRKILSSVV